MLENYTTRNIKTARKYLTSSQQALPSNFDGEYGRGLDDAGIKTVLSKGRGIRVEGNLQASCHPGQFCLVAPNSSDDEVVEYTPGGGVTATAMAVELDYFGRSAADEYSEGERGQLEIFNRGDEAWAGVSAETSAGADYATGDTLGVHTDGWLRASTATTGVMAILLHPVSKSDNTSRKEALALVRFV